MLKFNVNLVRCMKSILDYSLLQIFNSNYSYTHSQFKEPIVDQ